MDSNILEMRGISMYFPGIKALDGVDLSVRPGEVHALIGENGAGKSTLVKVLTGLYKPTAGTIIFEGKERRFATTVDAQETGIVAIHQEPIMFPDLSVAENVFSGHMLRRKGLALLDWPTMRARTRELCARIELDVNPDSMVSELSVAQRHMVGIARALSMNARLVIMDEPTSALSIRETEDLFKIIRQLRDAGTAILFISHKFDELFAIASSYTVLRDGKLVGSGDMKGATIDSLVRMMAGRETRPDVPQASGGDRRHGSRGQGLLLGQILQGRELLPPQGRDPRLLRPCGRRPQRDHEIPPRPRSPGFRRGHPGRREGQIPEPQRRPRPGALPMCPRTGSPRASCCSWGSITTSACPRLPGSPWDRLRGLEGPRTPSLASTGARWRFAPPVGSEAAMNLSGGNQQKVVLAKWLATKPRVLILDEPTKGIDVGTKAAVHEFMSQLAAEGMAIIMISSELPEVMGMADRVAVMHEGELVAVMDRGEASEEKILKAATGAAGEAA